MYMYLHLGIYTIYMYVIYKSATCVNYGNFEIVPYLKN